MPLGAVLFIVTMIVEVERIPSTCQNRSRTRRGMVDRIWWDSMGSDVRSRNDACLCRMHPIRPVFLGGWELPFQDTLVALPLVGGVFSALAAVTPGIAILLIKAYLMFALFVWVRASLTGSALTRSSSSVEIPPPPLYTQPRTGHGHESGPMGRVMADLASSLDDHREHTSIRTSGDRRGQGGPEELQQDLPHRPSRKHTLEGGTRNGTL